MNRRAKEALVQVLSYLREKSVGFVLLGALALVAAAVWYAIGRSLNGWVRGLLIGGLASILIFVLLRPEEAQRTLTGRTVRYGSNALILSIAAIGIVILLNYLSNRYYKRFDATEGRLHSLSPQSIQIVQEMDEEIEVIGVYPNGQRQDEFELWLDEYRAYTERIQYRYIDPIRQPGEADQLGWDGYGGGLIVRRGERSQEVYTPDEQDITSALLRVSRDTEKAIYFLTGHQEHGPDDFEEQGYSQLGSLLEENNYRVEPLNLVVTDTVPSDASIVVVAGPQTPLLDEEKERLKSYLLAGGKALIMIDPGPETGINDVLDPWGVRIENQIVIDVQKGLSGDAVTPVIDRYLYSQITKDLPMVALPVACPIVHTEATGGSASDPSTDATFTPLAQSSDRSWAEVDLDNLEDVAYDEGTDPRGPLTLIATIETSTEETRIVLIGDSDFLVNSILRQIPNGQFLLLNAVNWLAEEESLIAIGPKTNLPRRVQLSMVQEGAVCFGTLILIPAVIVIAGVVTWLRRR